MLNIDIRPINFEENIYDVVNLLRASTSLPFNDRILREARRLVPQDRQQHQIIATRKNQIIGFGDVGHDPQMAPGRFWIYVTVRENDRNLGIGKLLYDECLKYAISNHAAFLMTEVQGNSLEGLKFAESRGYKVTHDFIVSRLRLDNISLEMPQEVLHKQQGVEYFSFDDLSGYEMEFLDLYRSVAKDNPGIGTLFIPFEVARKYIPTASWCLSDCQIAAVKDGRWIGLCLSSYFEEDKCAYNIFTGVDKNFRRRGIAMKLKELSILKLKHYGAREIITTTDSRSAKMLIINRDLGYKAVGGYYVLTANCAD